MRWQTTGTTSGGIGEYVELTMYTNKITGPRRPARRWNLFPFTLEIVVAWSARVAPGPRRSSFTLVVSFVHVDLNICFFAAKRAGQSKEYFVYLPAAWSPRIRRAQSFYCGVWFDPVMWRVVSVATLYAGIYFALGICIHGNNVIRSKFVVKSNLLCYKSKIVWTSSPHDSWLSLTSRSGWWRCVRAMPQVHRHPPVPPVSWGRWISNHWHLRIQIPTPKFLRSI